ncbi:hypothetical protein L1S35_05215 [Flavobacterium sp. AS60]|uniref:hypothetical protein n=1 Tax=Flavobacterium anseongense TaxID=2910677 RepID=UPI001F3095C2|nr:hypothetical protein [Flavobacterium sp. AS60]MCF6129064.1 hypothetical protein [Flavobacterium sp. AS60]
MKLKFTYLLSFLIACGITSCKKDAEKPTPKVEYIISKEDSIQEAWMKANKVPSPLIPEDMKCYLDIVFILDSKKVYIYQTERNYNSNGKETKYGFPNYIGLKPEYFVAIENENFVSFLKDNNSLFGVFPEENIRGSFCIASETDTLKSKAFDNLVEELRKTKSEAFYRVRKTTEEENVVLKYKRSKQEFLPEKINWSKKFLNGNVKPFSKDYYEFESKLDVVRKAKETYKKKEKRIYM